MKQNVEEIIIKIKKRRKALGMTQAQVAKLCGIKQSNYSRFESGKQMPSLDTLLSILNVLGMDIHLTPVDYTVYDVMDRDEIVCIVELDRSRKNIKFNKIKKDGIGQPFSGNRLNLERFYSFLKDRCYEDGRADLDRILEKANLTSNNPYEFIKLSHGVTYEDTFWIKLHDEKIKWKDVKLI